MKPYPWWRKRTKNKTPKSKLTKLLREELSKLKPYGKKPSLLIFHGTDKEYKKFIKAISKL